jgi:hypothetical protein
MKTCQIPDAHCLDFLFEIQQILAIKTSAIIIQLFANVFKSRTSVSSTQHRKQGCEISNI